MDYKQKIYSNLSVHNESAMRDATLALGVLYNSKIAPAAFLKRTRIAGRNAGASAEIAKCLKAVCVFLGDGLNNYLSTFTPEQTAAHAITLGAEPSAVVMEAIRHSDPAINSGLTEDMLDTAEKYGIISKKDFFSFANLFAQIDRQEACLALKLKDTEDQGERAALRQSMVDSNCDGVAILFAAFSHIFSPDGRISDALLIDADLLHDVYPREMERGRMTQLSFHNIACLNRIVREHREGRIEPDAVIAKLEREGVYDESFRQKIYDLSQQYLRDKTIPISVLPEVMQEAIQENRREINGQIDAIKGRMRQSVYRFYEKANTRGGVSNHVARVEAMRAGRMDELGGNAPTREF